jgi:hypothetical protein
VMEVEDDGHSGGARHSIYTLWHPKNQTMGRCRFRRIPSNLRISLSRTLSVM